MNKISVAFLFLFFVLVADAAKAVPTVNTVAGWHPVPGYSGDGGPATAARLNSPQGGVFDNSGNFYFADRGNHRVRKINTSGIITTVAGNGTAGFSGDGGLAISASLSSPYSVAKDGLGNLYIADHSNKRIRKVDSAGIITTVAGGGAYDIPVGDVWPGDGGAATLAYFGNPVDVEISNTGEMFISADTQSPIRKVDSTGTISTPYPSVLAKGIAFSPSNMLYFTSASSVGEVFRVDAGGNVYQVAGNGVAGFSGDNGLGPAAQLFGAQDISFDSSGMLYIADSGNHRIRAIGSDGIIRTVAGTTPAGFSGDGGPATSAGMAHPSKVIFGSGAGAGYFIMDTGSLRIRAVSSVPDFSSPYEESFGPANAPLTSGLDSDRQGCAYGCNPVDLVSGAKLDYVKDYQNQSPFPIVWERRYDSRHGKWTFGYDRKILVAPVVAGRPMDVQLVRPDGFKIRYTRPTTSAPWETSDSKVLGSLTSQAVVGGERFDYTNLRDETEVYDAAGQLVELRNTIGQKLSFEYHSSGDLERIEDDFGRYLDVRMTAVTAGSNPISVTDGDKTVEYVFVTSGTKKLLTQVVYPDGENVDYLYDEALTAGQGLLTGIVGEDEVRWATYTYSFDYGPTPFVLSTQHGAGLDLTVYDIYPGAYAFVSWDAGMVQFDLSHPQVTASNKTKGSSQACPNCGGASVLDINYNAQGVPTDYKGFDNVEVERVVNARGLPDSETLAPGTSDERTTTYTWQASSRNPLTVDEQVDIDGVPATRTTVYEYDVEGRLEHIEVSNSGGGSARHWRWTYNAQGLPLTVLTPSNGLTAHTYDLQGNLSTSENTQGHVTTYGDYTPQGLVGTITDPNGLQIKMAYDGRDRVVEVKRGTAGTHWETMGIEYEPYGQVKKITQPDGSWVKYAYDSAHRLVEVEDQRGKLVLTLNNDGDTIEQQVFDENNTLVAAQEMAYDTKRRLKNTIDAQNNTTTYDIDGANRIVGATDPDGDVLRQWQTSFDSMGRPSSFSQPDAAQQLVYDRSGNIVSARDSNFVYTTYGYNGFGDQVYANSPDNGFTTYFYDRVGRNNAIIDGRGAATNFLRDFIGRPYQVEHNGAGTSTLAADETQDLTWDTCSNGIGRICEVSDHSGTTAFTYDLWGRVLTKTVTPAGGASSFTLITSYAYNNAGQLVSTTYPSGKRVDLTYDRGLPETIEYDFQPILSNLTYRPFGTAVTGWDWNAFAGQVHFDYDLNGRISSIEDADERDYVRNAKGWILGITDPVDATADQAYAYNGRQSLTQADLAARPDPIDFIVDDNGNVARKVVGPLSSDATYFNFTTNYSIDNRLPSWANDVNVYYLTYDEVGNTIDNGAGLTTVYDAKNRPRSTSWLGTNATYAFNAMGQRVRKSGSHLSTGHRFYAYDEAGRTLGEYDGNGEAIEEYVYLDGFRPVALVRNIGLSLVADIYPVLTDHLGTPRKVLDDTGAPQWTWDAKDPYGHQMPDQLVGGSTFVFNLRFPGQRYDSETGLYHNGFRDYNPATGRYVQADPIGLAGGWNPYVYVQSNPINASDSSGLIIDQESLGNPNVDAALSYLSASPIAKDMISRAKKSKRNLTITEAFAGRTTFIPHRHLFSRKGSAGGKITWDPSRGIYCGASGMALSPAMSLLHEIAHFLQYETSENVDYLDAVTDAFVEAEVNRWLNAYEMDAVATERQVAFDLGELQRKSYRDPSYESVIFPSVTSKTPLFPLRYPAKNGNHIIPNIH